jgi:hypothetical protein
MYMPMRAGGGQRGEWLMLLPLSTLWMGTVCGVTLARAIVVPKHVADVVEGAVVRAKRRVDRIDGRHLVDNPGVPEPTGFACCAWFIKVPNARLASDV